MKAGDAISICLFVAGAGLVAAAQLPAREKSLTLKETSDAYLLPPPEHLIVMSLGYRAALADMLWANVLVTQGIRMEQRRAFDTVDQYLAAIVELDPKFREPYRLSDTLLTFQAVESGPEEAYKARAILERAVKEHPLDAELWLQLGQFVAFIAAPSYLKDPAEKERWRNEGAAYLARAAELGVSDPNVQWQALGGAGIFHRAGRTEEAIAFLQRLAATTDDDELRQKVEAQIRSLSDSGGMEAAMEQAVRDAAVEKQKSQFQAFLARKPLMRKVWQSAYPGRSEDFVMSAGPAGDPAACAGGASSKNADSPQCAPDWAEFARRVSEGGTTPPP